jgi:hypothetical protein
MDPAITVRQQHQRNEVANGSATQWPTLLGRMIEDLSRVMQLELQLLEAGIASSLIAMADRAIARLVMLCAGVIGGSCLLAALILAFHERMQMEWWECFAIGGVVAIVCGLGAYLRVTGSTASAETKAVERSRGAGSH